MKSTKIVTVNSNIFILLVNLIKMSANISNIKENTENVSKLKLQEINDLYMLLKKEHQKYTKTDIFLDTILESLNPTYGIIEILGVKIKDIILRGELVDCLTVKKDGKAKTDIILLDDFNNIELTFDEQKDLKLALEHRLKEKKEHLLKDLNDLTDNDACNLEDIVQHIKFDAETEKNNLLSWQKKLTEQQTIHINNLVKLGGKLDELLSLKTETALNTSAQKVDEIMKKTTKFNLKYRLLYMQSRLSIFKELSFSLDAYRQAIRDLKQQQDEYNEEIDQLKRDLENYKIMAKNEEFQEILRLFKQYKRGYDNKLWIFNELSKVKF